MQFRNINTAYVLIAAVSLFSPLSAFAATTFKSFVEDTVIPLGDQIITAMYVLAFLFFIALMANYFFFSPEKGREKGKKYIFASIVGFAVIASTWALVHVLINTLTAIPNN